MPARYLSRPATLRFAPCPALDQGLDKLNVAADHAKEFLEGAGIPTEVPHLPSLPTMDEVKATAAAYATGEAQVKSILSTVEQMAVTRMKAFTGDTKAMSREAGMAAMLLIAKGGAEVGAGGGGAKGSDIVYRGLAEGEDVAQGLSARAPGAGNSAVSHVAGARSSQWISTTRSLEIAKERFGQHGVVAIDLSKVSSPVLDLTKGIPGLGPNSMLARWAINAQEVLVQGSIPAEAITVVK